MGYISAETNGATGAFDITPADATDLQTSVRAIYVGGTGDIKVDHVDGSTVTYTGVEVGIFPVQVNRVYATGTTATSLIGMV